MSKAHKIRNMSVRLHLREKWFLFRLGFLFYWLVFCKMYLMNSIIKIFQFVRHLILTSYFKFLTLKTLNIIKTDKHIFLICFPFADVFIHKRLFFSKTTFLNGNKSCLLFMLTCHFATVALNLKDEVRIIESERLYNLFTNKVMTSM